MSLALPARSSHRTRVAVVDADRRVQQSVAEILELTDEVEVIGTAGDVRVALELIAAEAPEVVIVDPRLPDLEAGIALVSGIGRGWPATRIVMTGWNDPIEFPRLAAAACAYVSKSASPEEFVAAVVAACRATAQA